MFTRLSGGQIVLLAVTIGTAGGIWLIHDTQRVEREVNDWAETPFPVTLCAHTVPKNGIRPQHQPLAKLNCMGNMYLQVILELQEKPSKGVRGLAEYFQ